MPARQQAINDVHFSDFVIEKYVTTRLEAVFANIKHAPRMADTCFVARKRKKKVRKAYLHEMNVDHRMRELYQFCSFHIDVIS